MLIDISGNGGSTEWVSEVVALMTDRALTRREALRVAPACDRSAVWQGAPPPCSVFAPASQRNASLRRVKVIPVDVLMPNCARFLEDGANEIEGIAADNPLPMKDADAEVQIGALRVVMARY